MKKILNKAFVLILQVIIILSLMLINTGCKQPSESTDTAVQQTETQVETTLETKATETIPETVTAETQEDLSKEIETKFGELDKSVDNIGNIFIFIDQNIKDATPELASEIVYTVMKLCEEYKFDFTDKFSDPEVQSTINDLLSSLEQIDLNTLIKTNNQKVKDLIQEAIDKKYKLMAVEGFIMPLVDYRAYDVFRTYLTQEMKDYIDIKLDESERPSVMDAGIVIPIDDFIQRILKSMDYITNYPDSPRADEIDQFNTGRIFMYLSGIDNNPVFDSNQKILPDRLSEFEDNLTKYGDTKFGKILGSYLDLLAQENYIRTQMIDDFLNNLQ
jgi:hypothetical protein